MEIRIAKLEANVDHSRSDVTDLKADMADVEATLAQLSVMVAHIDAKLDSMMDHKWLTVFVLGVVAVILRSEVAALFQ